MTHIHLANQNCSSTISTGLLVFKKKDKTVSPLKSSWWFSSLNRAWHQLWAGQLSAWAKQTCLNNATSGDVEGWLRERATKRRKSMEKKKQGEGEKVEEECGGREWKWKKGEAASCFGQVPECLGMCNALVYGRFPQTGLSKCWNPQPCAWKKEIASYLPHSLSHHWHTVNTNKHTHN